MTNWDSVLSNNKNVNVFRSFAQGDLSGRELYSKFANTQNGGVVRDLLRSGVDRARTLTRKALYRRDFV